MSVCAEFLCCKYSHLACALRCAGAHLPRLSARPALLAVPQVPQPLAQLGMEA